MRVIRYKALKEEEWIDIPKGISFYSLELANLRKAMMDKYKDNLWEIKDSIIMPKVELKKIQKREQLCSRHLWE